ncbi:hypothetical protein BFP77_15965 [Maribacter sp. 4U21]|nr:hypothetical protein BFP77_15965 [Maribacter sp. 4U21]
MVNRGKILQFERKPKKLNLVDKNLKVNYSYCKYENYKKAKIRIKINDFHSSLTLCNRCLEIDRKFIKAILLKAYIFFEINDCHRGYCNIFLAQDIELLSKKEETLTFTMLVRYLKNVEKIKRKYIVDYLQIMKEIKHEYVCDI